MFKSLFNKLFSRHVVYTHKKARDSLLQICEDSRKLDQPLYLTLANLYDLLGKFEITPPADTIQLRGVTVPSMFSSSQEALQFVIEILDGGAGVVQFQFNRTLGTVEHRYLDWRTNNYTIEQLISLYSVFVYYFYLYRANKAEKLTIEEVNEFQKLTTFQLEFFSTRLAIQLKDEVMQFYSLILDLHIGVEND